MISKVSSIDALMLQIREDLTDLIEQGLEIDELAVSSSVRDLDISRGDDHICLATVSGDPLNVQFLVGPYTFDNVPGSDSAEFVRALAEGRCRVSVGRSLLGRYDNLIVDLPSGTYRAARSV